MAYHGGMALPGSRLRTFLAVSLAIATALAGVPAGAAPKPDRPAGVTIEGDILAEGGGSAEGALVTAVHLESSQMFLSEKTGSSGHFRITGLPYGYFQLAVTQGGKLHLGLVPVNVGPGAHLKIDLTLLAQYPVTETGEPVTIPLLGKPAEAGIEIRGLDRKPFFKTTAGAATLIGGSVGLLLLLTN